MPALESAYLNMFRISINPRAVPRLTAFFSPLKYYLALITTLTMSAEAFGWQLQADSSGTVSMTLDQVWEKVRTNSKAIQIRQIQQHSQTEGIKDAKADRLPQIDAEGEYARVSNMPVFENGIFHTPAQFPVLHAYYKIGGSAYFNLYSGQKNNLEIAERKVGYQIATEQTAMTISEMKLRSAAYYLDMQRSIVFKGLLVKDIEAQKKQLQRIKTLQLNGAVLKSDVLRAELKLSKQTFALIQLENDLAIANEKLNTLLGLPDKQRILPADRSDPDAISLNAYDDYLSYAKGNAYQVKIVDQERELSRLYLKDVKANVSPRLGLFANYAYSYPQIFLYPYSANVYGFGMAGIKATFSISAFYQNSHKEKIAKLNSDLKDVESEQVRDNIREDVNDAFLRFQEAIKRVRLSETNVKQATENRRIVNSTYFNHLSLITDLLDADTQLLQTHFDLAASKIAAQLQYYQLLNITGKL
jgi:outer membrane protein